MDLVTWIGALKSFTTRAAWRTGWRGALWQPSFWDRRLRDRQEVEDTVAYVLRNPLAAELVREEMDWPWSFVDMR
jgi:hypothetical protein